MKVQNLAKELQLSPKEFMAFLRDMGIFVKSPSHKLDPGKVNKIKAVYESKQRKSEEDNQRQQETKSITIKTNTMTVSDMVAVFEVPLPEVMKAFLKKGLLLNVNSEIDPDTIVEVGAEVGVDVTIDDGVEEAKIALKSVMLDLESEDEKSDPKQLKARPPVITIMGHVDHGKTLLLDTIRKENVVDKEAGGITQHIGAYQIKHNDQYLTFLDTPGHEAFTSLRARGAQITDIAVLVVAADDGIKPQTEEAIHHAQAADVPIIVALNKIDKPNIDIDKCKQQLSEFDLLAEDWGGKTVMVPVSAKSGKGIDDLLDMLAITSDMLELKANPKGFAKGVIIESHLSRQKGAVASVLVKTGTLKVGNHFVVGPNYGKIRALFDDQGNNIKSVGPGSPAEILGLSEVPEPGAVLAVYKTEKEARAVAQERQLTQKEEQFKGKQSLVSLETMSSQIEEGELRQLNLVIKSDVNGSLEAIKGSIEKIDNKDIPIQILHAATGSITENDVMLAKASNALVIGFGVEASSEATKIGESNGISIKSYSIIYELLDDIEKVIKGLYKPEYEEIELGTLEVRQLFKFSKVGTIAGCHVESGKITRNNLARVVRGKEEIYSGKVESLKRFKDDVKEVQSGYECGIVLEKFTDLQEGDLITAYESKRILL